MNFLCSQVSPHGVEYFGHLSALNILTLHDELIQHVLVLETVLSLQTDDSLQHFGQYFLIETLESGSVTFVHFEDMGGQVDDAHVEQVVPGLRIVDIFEFLVAFFDER